MRRRRPGSLACRYFVVSARRLGGLSATDPCAIAGSRCCRRREGAGSTSPQPREPACRAGQRADGRLGRRRNSEGRQVIATVTVRRSAEAIRVSRWRRAGLVGAWRSEPPRRWCERNGRRGAVAVARAQTQAPARRLLAVGSRRSLPRFHATGRSRASPSASRARCAEHQRSSNEARATCSGSTRLKRDPSMRIAARADLAWVAPCCW